MTYYQYDAFLQEKERIKKQKEIGLATILDILNDSTLEETGVANILKVKEKKVYHLGKNTVYQGILSGFIRVYIDSSFIEIVFNGYTVYYKDKIYSSNSRSDNDCFVIDQEIRLDSKDEDCDIIRNERKRIEDIIFKNFPKYTPVSMFDEYDCGCELFRKMCKEMLEFKNLSLEQYYYHMPSYEREIYKILFKSGVDRSRFTEEDDVIHTDTNDGTYVVKLFFQPLQLEYEKIDTSSFKVKKVVDIVLSPKCEEWARALKVKFFHHYEKHRDMWKELGVL